MQNNNNSSRPYIVIGEGLLLSLAIETTYGTENVRASGIQCHYPKYENNMFVNIVLHVK